MSQYNAGTQDVPAFNKILLDFEAAIEGAPIIDKPIRKISMRRSTRERRSAIPNDYYVYLWEADYDIGQIMDPIIMMKLSQVLNLTCG